MVNNIRINHLFPFNESKFNIIKIIDLLISKVEMVLLDESLPTITLFLFDTKVRGTILKDKKRTFN